MTRAELVNKGYKKNGVERMAESRGEMGQETADSLHAKNSRDSLQRRLLRLLRVAAARYIAVGSTSVLPGEQRESVIQLRILARPALSIKWIRGETLLPRY